MRNLLVIILLCMTVTSHVTAQDLSLFEKKEFVSSRGDTLLYRVLYPANYDPGRKYPLILVLHGAGERGNDNEKQLVHGGKLFLADSNRIKYPAIILFPQCPQNSYWSSVKIDRTTQPLTIAFDYASSQITPPLNSAIELTRSYINDGKADRRRVYVTGLSMGGMGTFEAVYREPKLFAAAAPICGGGDTKAYSKQSARVPFRIFHGADDAVVSVDLSRAMVGRLKELNASVQYVEYPDVNHNSWDNAFAEPDFLGWFFGNRR